MGMLCVCVCVAGGNESLCVRYTLKNSSLMNVTALPAVVHHASCGLGSLYCPAVTVEVHGELCQQ